MTSVNPIDRRTFLAGSAAAALLPWGGLRWVPGGDDLVLVVIELVGGNDGLHTLVPLDDPALAAARPRLARIRRRALDVGDGFGLHPALGALHRPFREGRIAAVHGVGFPGALRSHFHSRDVWHTADPTVQTRTAATTGWMGRIADLRAAASATPLPGVAVGDGARPLALRGRSVLLPGITRADDLQLRVDPTGGEERQEERRAALAALAAAGTGRRRGAYVARVAREALRQVEHLRTSTTRYRPRADYPDHELGRHLRTVARLAAGGHGTRLLHVRHVGYDTHADQAREQGRMLRQLGDALGALLTDLHAHDTGSGVVVLVHSEFGRRVTENDSGGTDHGKAGPVLVCGGGVRGGHHGTPPSLEDLDDGDLKVTTDFRHVYADVLRHLEVDDRAVLGAHFPGLGLFG